MDSPDTAPDDIQILRERSSRTPIRVVLFDFDGTVSLLREGWPSVMAPVMLEAIAGGAPPTPEMEQAVQEYIEASTGINTILQMEELVEMVRQFGRVPEDHILDAHEYKAIYNERLMQRVNQRIKHLESGELSCAEATVLGSVDFVKQLRGMGVTLYVFSGTDQPDVQNEARLLGVADYFDAIYGALRTYAESNKEQVLRDLMNAHRLDGAEVAVFGDGPVEIACGCERNCVTVGVASDEVRGYGWNLDKKTRLTQAGADALIPDFSNPTPILEWLGLI